MTVLIGGAGRRGRCAAPLAVRLLAVGVFAAPLLAAGPAGAVSAKTAERSSYCHGGGPGGSPLCVSIERYDRDLCGLIAHYADAHGLPRGFFARLIWQESRFNPNARSPVGAQGVAQFMPGTARLRGLANAYNPAEALSASAKYLAEMRRSFGSLGLAAAAYNAGEGRIERVRRGASGAPYETRHYVHIITGHTVDEWVKGVDKKIDYALEAEAPFLDSCVKLASTRKLVRKFEGDPATWKPWGVQVAAHFKHSVAQRMFARVRSRHGALLGGEQPMVKRVRNRSFGRRARYAMLIGRDSRAEAIRLCKRLRGRGGACVVVRN